MRCLCAYCHHSLLYYRSLILRCGHDCMPKSRVSRKRSNSQVCLVWTEIVKFKVTKYSFIRVNTVRLLIIEFSYGTGPSVRGVTLLRRISFLCTNKRTYLTLWCHGKKSLRNTNIYYANARLWWRARGHVPFDYFVKCRILYVSWTTRTRESADEMNCRRTRLI